MARFVDNNIPWTEDPENINQSWDQTIKLRAGDCEDRAMLACVMLYEGGFLYDDFGNGNRRAVGLDVQWNLQSDGSFANGHAVCLYKSQQGELYYIDGGMIRGPFTSSEAAALDVAQLAGAAIGRFTFFDRDYHLTLEKRYQ